MWLISTSQQIFVVKQEDSFYDDEVDARGVQGGGGEDAGGGGEGGAAVRGGAPGVHLAPYRRLHPPRHPHRPPLSPLRPQSGPGKTFVSVPARHHPSCCIQEYEKVVIFRLGRILGGGERGPGIFFIVPCTDKFEIVDMRVQNWSVPPQEMITRLNFDVLFRDGNNISFYLETVWRQSYTIHLATIFVASFIWFIPTIHNSYNSIVFLTK